MTGVLLYLLDSREVSEEKNKELRDRGRIGFAYNYVGLVY